MARSGELDRPQMGRRRRRIPYAIRLLLAALFAAAVALGVSYALRRLNY